ncbi:MAG: DUF5908 family protein [Chitinophagales bacterium]
MPIEIKELVVTAFISEKEEKSNREGSGVKFESQTSQAADRMDIVSECVEQVLEILKNKTER